MGDKNAPFQPYRACFCIPLLTHCMKGVVVIVSVLKAATKHWAAGLVCKQALLLCQGSPAAAASCARSLFVVSPVLPLQPLASSRRPAAKKKKTVLGEQLFKCSHRCYSFMAKTIPSLSCSEFYCEYWSCPVRAGVLIPPLRYLQSPATLLLRRGAVCHCYLRGCC